MNVPACCRFWARLVLAIFAFTICAIPIQAADHVIALKAARLFDGKSKALVKNAVVIVQGDKIVDVGSNVPTPSGAQVIDLGDATLSPGFMDAHTHLTLDYSGDYNIRRLHGSAIWGAGLSAAANLSMSRCAIRSTKA